MLKRLLIVAALVVTSSSAMNVSSVGATQNPDSVCVALDSKKIDVQGNEKSITITAPEGQVITGYCVKAGSAQQDDGPKYVTGLSAATVIITHPSGKDISHYSYSLAPKADEGVANVKYSLICETLTQTAKITFTNAGTKAGQVELNSETFSVAAGASVVKDVAIAATGTMITIKIDGVKVFDELYKCIGGQGGGVTPPVPTPVVTTPAPVAGAGESAVVVADEEVKTDVASLPYTAGGVNIAVLIAALAAVLTVVISFIAKKTFLKQI